MEEKKYRLYYGSLLKLFVGSVILGSGFAYWYFYFFHFILVFVFLVLLSNKNIVINYKPVFSKYFGLPFFFLLWYITGIAWSYSRLDTLRYIVYIFLGISIVFIFSTWVITIERYRYILKVVKNLVLFEYVIVLLEILKLFRWPTSPLSTYAHILKRQQMDFSGYSESILTLMSSMPTGFLGNPNDLSIFVLMTLPFFLFSKRNLVRIAATVFVLLTIIFTSSRGVFIAFLFGIIVCFFFYYKRVFLIAIFTVLLLFITDSFNAIIEKVKMSNNSRIAEIADSVDILMIYLTENDKSGGSISVRQQLIENGIKEFWKTNGLGAGGGSSTIIQKEKYGSDITSMHNFWIELLVDGGFIGFFLFLIWYLCIIAKLFFISIKSRNSYIVYVSRSLFLSMCFFLVGCISASSVIYMLQMWLMLGMGIAIIYIEKSHQ
jgi:teichuronic acid biosynthesis protein TuaE